MARDFLRHGFKLNSGLLMADKQPSRAVIQDKGFRREDLISAKRSARQRIGGFLREIIGKNRGPGSLSFIDKS